VSRVVVLLGAPGSGKSTIGGLLGEVGFRWREWEPWILERWGSREAFVAAKAEALPLLQREIRSWIDEGGGVAVIESTGLSDSAFLDELDADGGCFVVRLDVSEEAALRRVRSREQGRHLTDDLTANARVWSAFRELVVPARRCDVVVDTETTSAVDAAEQVASRMRGAAS
jgi:shikimate kinase